MPRRGIVTRLYDYFVDEISLVDRGGNQHANVLISKRDEVTKSSPSSSSVHHERPLTDDEDDERKRRLSNDEEGGVTVVDADELKKADLDDEDLLALLEQVAARRKKQKMAAAPEEEEAGLGLGALEGEGEEEDEDPFAFEDEEDGDLEDEEDTDPFAEEEDESPFGAEEEEGAEGVGNELLPDLASEDEPKAMPGDLPEEVAEYVNELERTVDEMERRFKEEGKAEVGKTETVIKADADLSPEEVSFLEELAKSFEAGDIDADEVISKALDEVSKAQKEASTAMAIAKAERDMRVSGEFIAKVESAYPHLPVTAAELGPVLKAAHDALDDEQYEVLEKALAANDAITNSITDKGGKVTGIFHEVGKSGSISESISKLDAQADEMVAKGEAKSHEEAVAKLYSANPELYDQYLSDNEAQVR